MTNAVLLGKPDAGNPHVRFDEGEVASATTPKRGSLLYKRMIATITAAVGIAMGVLADPVDLAKLEYSTRMGDGIILTGELKKNVQLGLNPACAVLL